MFGDDRWRPESPVPREAPDADPNREPPEVVDTGDYPPASQLVLGDGQARP